MLALFDTAAIAIIFSLVFFSFKRSLSADHDREEINLLLRILILGMAFKIIVITIWFHEVGHSFNYHKIWGYQGGDSVLYDRIGWQLAQYFKNGSFFSPEITEIFDFYGRKYVGYYYTVGLIYTIFGHQQFMVTFFNTLLSIIIALMAYRIAFHTLNKKTALLSFVFVLFYPHFISASYYILKDVAIVFLVAGAIWGLTTRALLIKKLILFSVFTLLLVFFRSPLALILLAGGVAHLLIQEMVTRRSVVRWGIAFLLIGSIFFSIGLQNIKQNEFVKRSLYYGTGVKAHHTENPGLMIGVRSPIQAVARIINNPQIGIKFIIQLSFFYFWGPHMLYSRTNPSFFPFWLNISGILHIALMPMFLYGVWHSLKAGNSKIFICIFFIIALYFGLLMIGVNYRYRLAMIPFFLIFAAIGCTKFNDIKFGYIPYILFFNLFVVANASMRESFIVAKPLLLITVVMVSIGIYAHRRSVL